jgi:hypothetical protein
MTRRPGGKRRRGGRGLLRLVPPADSDDDIDLGLPRLLVPPRAPGDPGDDIDQALAHNLRRAREALGLTTSETVARAGISEDCGTRMESRPGDLILTELDQIAAALNTTSYELIHGVS